MTIDNAAVTTSSNISFSTLTIGSGTNTTSLTLTNNITSGGSITINNAGTLTQNNKVQQTITGTLTINSGGNLTHTANTTTNLYNVNFSAATITVTGSINVTDKGYSPGNGTGTSTDQYSSASYGGKGAGATAGATYGSITNPTDIGSGSGINYGGTSGAGAIILTVTGTLTVNGSITASGTTATTSSQNGGSGGSVNLTVGTLAGTGTISANGANRGGAGGRIAINYTTDSFSSGTITAYGGTSGSGGPGTIYKVTQTGTNKVLIIKNNSVDTGNTAAELKENLTLNDLQLSAQGRLDVKSGYTLTLPNNYANTNGDTTGILINNGIIDFSGSTYTLSGYILWANYHDGTQFTGLTDLTIGSSGTLSHGSNSSAKTYYINLSLTNLTVTGTIDISSKGYTSSNGPGTGADIYSGGSYGGRGGSASGVTYGSLINPVDIGSGSGANYGTSGGGAVTLTISGTLTVTGTINASGREDTNAYGQGQTQNGGSGGSVNISAGTLTGTGTIKANGGNGNGRPGGGGGRAAILATTNTLTGSTTASGGTGSQSGLDGSIYFGSPTFTNVTVTANANASATISSVKTIAFWVKPTASTAKMIQLATGVDISSTTGTLSSNGITSPTYYVNSIQGGLMITQGVWNHVVITTPNGITANSILLGQTSGGYLSGQIDDVRLYTTEYSSGQVLTLYSDSNTLAKLTLAQASEQAGPAPLVYWKFDEGTGTTTKDSSGNNITATLAGSTIPTWQTEDNCTSGKCLYLNGSSSKLTISSISPVSNIKSVGLWVKPTSVTSLALIDLDGGTHKITVASGVISATGFTSPTIFVNGKASTTLSSSSWQYVEVTTTTGFTPTTALTLGNSASTYLTGYLDEVKLYDYTRSSNQILTDYAGKKAPIGASMIITPASYSSGQAPIGHWRLDENTGTTANDSSSATTPAPGTISGANWKPGKYGASLNFDGTDDQVTVAQALTGIKTVSLWVNPTTTTQYFIDLDGGSHYIFSSSGTITASGFTGTVNIYVNGVLNGTVTANQWNHIAVTNTTAFSSTSSMTFGKSGSNYLNGKLDDIRIYNYARTQKQVISDMMGDGARSPVRASGGGSGGTGGQGGLGRAGGAVGYYKFDEGYGTTANDSSGNSNNLTLSSASWTLGGKFNKAFNGTGSLWVSRTDDSDFDVSDTDDYTVSFWFKSDSATNPTAIEYLVNKANVTTAGYAVYANTSGNICIGIDDDTTWGPDISSCSPDDIYDNTWHHIVAIRDNSSTDKTLLYVDGILKDSDTDTTTATLANSLSLYIGDRDGVDNGDEFNGDIDEVKFYRYILTAAEVKLDYNKGSSQVLGALGDKTGTGYESNQSANQEYCIPGDATSCAAPVGRWDFDENTGNTVNDRSGNNNTGTWNGTLGNQWKPGKNSPGGNFNGSDNYVSTPDASSLDVTTGLTLQGWVYLTSASSTVRMPFAKQNAYYLAIINNSTHDLYGKIFIGGLQKGVQTTTSISVNTWIHIAMTYDGSTIRYYVNGTQVASTPQTGNIDNSNYGFFVGDYNNESSPFPWSGKIDQVRIFNYARSAAQVAWDYNRGAPLGHWKFNECQGNIAHDSAIPPGGGSAYHGTINLGTTGTQTTALGMGTCTASASTPWYNGRTGKFNYSLNFDGTDDYIGSIPSILGIQSVSLWVKPSSSTASMLALTASAYITSSSGTVSATGFTSPTIYVNGISGGTLTGAAWNHVVVTTGTGITASAITLGLANSVYLNGQLDDARVYNYALTGTQVKLLSNQGAAVRYGPFLGAP